MKLVEQMVNRLAASAPSFRRAVPARMQFGPLLASLFSMAWFVEARDPYTGGHLWRVSRYARLLAQAQGLQPHEVARASLGGFLHDLGKIGIPDTILLKSDRLTRGEFEVIKTHPDIGARMLAGHPLAFVVIDVVRLHHERPDGEGYPLGLIGSDIPLEARIVGICDAFDSMTSQRPYRSAIPRDAALAIVRELLCRQFDRPLGERFIELGATGVLDHVIGHSDEGIPLQSCPMCGPTLVVRRDNQTGDRIYCRNCGGEFALEERDAHLVATPTGARGNARDLEPNVDTALIARAVQAAVDAIPMRALLQQRSVLLAEPAPFRGSTG